MAWARPLLFFVLAWGVVLTALPPPGEELSEEQQVDILLDQGAAVSDLRAPGSTPFRLHARTKTRMGSKNVEGDYVLLWVSPEQWRQEITFPGYTDVKVGGKNSYWQARNIDFTPLPVWSLEQLLNISATLSDVAAFPYEKRELRDDKEKGSPIQCAKLTFKRHDHQLCFNDAGALIRSAAVGDKTEYSDYISFEGKLFPRSIRMTEHRETFLQVSVLLLETIQEPAPQLFRPPPGATRWIWCQSKPRPKGGSAPSRLLFDRYARHHGTVSVYAVVDAEGHAHNVQLLQTVGQVLDNAVLDAVRKWKFAPAVCDGMPVPSQTVVSFEFPR